MIAPSDWSQEGREAFAIMDSSATKEVGSASNMAMTLAQHPRLAAAYYTFGKYLALDSTLSPRVRELVTLRVAWLLKSDYEWCHHVRFAKAIGVTGEEIDAIREGPTSSAWCDDDKCFLQVVDDLYFKHKLDEATWRGLSQRLDRQQVMDLVFTIGHYISTALVLSAFNIRIEAGFAREDHPLER
jgi:alkylhydroperoxidase family enzyme